MLSHCKHAVGFNLCGLLIKYSTVKNCKLLTHGNSEKKQKINSTWG